MIDILVLLLLIVVFYFATKKSLKMLKEGNCSKCDCSIDFDKIRQEING